MEIVVCSSSESVKHRIRTITLFYAALIGLQRFTHTVYIKPIRGLVNNVGGNGQTYSAPHLDKAVEVLIDANLPFSQLMTTLAHEMVHVKQIVSGLLRTDFITTNKNSLQQRLFWRGQDMTHLDYLDRPWEKQAFSQESLMVRRLDNFLTTN